MANNVYCPENTTWYDTWQLWDDAAAATLTSTWTGEQANVELTASFTISGSTSSATNYKILKTGSGASFKDNANAATNALRYNASNGAGNNNSATYDSSFTIAEPYTRVIGLQFNRNYNNGSHCFVINNSSSSAYILVNDCIIESQLSTGACGQIQDGAVKFTNCLFVKLVDSTSAHGLQWYSGNGTGSGLFNCTIVKPSDKGGGGSAIRFTTNYNDSIYVKNCAIFGFAETDGGSTHSFTSGSGYNATDNSAAPGSSNQTSATYADQFEATADSTRDFRAK